PFRKHPFEISLRLLCSHPFFAPSCSPAKNLQKPSAKPHSLEKKMASPRAQVSIQLTSDQLQRLAKIPICSGKSVEFSHLSGNLAWVEETLTAMGWTKLCQISEPFVASAVRSFYASLKVSNGNTVVGYVKGTEITISEEYLVELLDCPNSGHCHGEFIPLEKQKLGIIGSLGTLCKRGLKVNELSAEKRLIYSIISNIITPRAGTHSSITTRDGNLLFWAIQRHRVNLPAVILERMIAAKDLQESLPYESLLTMIFKKLSVDLSGDVHVSTKEKIGLITLIRSHYSLDSVPECEHEIYPDEPPVSLLTQDIPASSVQIKTPVVPAISDVFVQPPEPIIEQVAQPVIPSEVPFADAQLPASTSFPEQDASSETVHDVLRDLRGKGILSEDVPISPMEHIFEEREPSYSPSQFETRPRSQGESSNSLSTILELVRTQQENLSVLHMQVEVIDVKFDSLANEVKQIKYLMLQFVCQQGTPRPAGPAPSQQQEEVPSAQEPQHQDQTQEKFPENQELEQIVETDQEIQADQPPISDEIHQQQQVSEPQLAMQQQQESVADQQPAAAATEEEVSLGKRPLEASLEVHTFKRKVKRRLIKNGNPIRPSPSSRPSSPAPPVINPPEITPAAPSSTALVLEVSSLDIPSSSIPVDPTFKDIHFSIYPLQYQPKPLKEVAITLSTQPRQFYSSLPTVPKPGSQKTHLQIIEMVPSLQLPASRGPKLGDKATLLLPPFWYAFVYHSPQFMALFREYLQIRAFLEIHNMPGFTFEHWLPTLIKTSQVSIPELQIVSQKSHYLTPQEFVDLYPEEAMRFQEAQSRNHHLKIYTHISLQFHDLFATLLRDSQAKYTAMKAFNFERFKLGLHDVSRGQYDMLIRGQRPVVPSMTASLLPDLHPPLVGAVLYRGPFADTLYNRFLQISTRFKIKYKSKLSFQRFLFLHLPKFQKNLLDLQLSFAESERFTPDQWEKAYPDHHAQCQRMKLTLNKYHSKSLLDLRKHIGLKWAHRYL
ncbi:hypothetical protein Taro_048179, partial [Colocasia esculenta]|nr:hypothetical protein [Colocasia esculenta]